MWGWTTFWIRVKCVCVCVCVRACACVYSGDLTQQQSEANMCAASLGGALGWLFRSLTIVCRRQFFFVWKFTNHQWKCHRYGRSVGVKSLSPAVASVGWCWAGGDGGCDVFAPSAQQLFLGSYQLTDFRTIVNISSYPEVKLLWSLFFLKGSPLKLDGNNEKVYIFTSLFFSIYTQIN